MVWPTRDRLVRQIAARIAALPGPGFARVAVDGVDGAGKTMLADELAAALQGTARPPVRASVDGFHASRAARYRMGRESPEGFYRDSYDYEALRRVLLEPLGPGGNGVYCPAVFDHVTDAPLPASRQVAPPRAALILDGIFLHRPELRGMWDLSIWLDVPFAVSVPRGAARGHGFGSADPDAAVNRRYVEGQRLYLREADPASAAGLVIDNADLSAPKLLRDRTAPTLALRLRAARPEDWQEVSALRLSVAENRLSDPSRVTRAMYEEYVTTSGRGWVAEDGTGILGFAVGHRSGEVWALFVRPGSEGRGIGQALLRECVAWMAAQGLEEAVLETGAGTRAERFYRTFGWHEAGRTERDVTFRLRLR